MKHLFFQDESKRIQNISHLLPPRAGFKWLGTEDMELKRLFQQGGDVISLSSYFERSTGSISAQLKKLGLISEAFLGSQYSKQQHIDTRLHKIKSSFRNYSITSLWHMTHKDNIKTILEEGLLSHNTMHSRPRGFADISNHDVQAKRARIKEAIYGLSLHDYVPLYINPRNPMLYTCRGQQDEICLLEIDVSLIAEKKYVFTDGNASSRDSDYYAAIDKLEALPWTVLQSNFWNKYPDGARKMCAEFLIYENIEPQYLKAIHCCSTRSQQALFAINVNAAVTPNNYF